MGGRRRLFRISIPLTCAIAVQRAGGGGHELNVHEKTGNVHYALKIRPFSVWKLPGSRATGSARYGFQ